jgi:hypothetical protein
LIYPTPIPKTADYCRGRKKEKLERQLEYFDFFAFGMHCRQQIMDKIPPNRPLFLFFPVVYKGAMPPTFCTRYYTQPDFQGYVISGTQFEIKKIEKFPKNNETSPDLGTKIESCLRASTIWKNYWQKSDFFVSVDL